MGRLVPADELANALLDADAGPVVELTRRAAQVGRGGGHVPRLVGHLFDDRFAAERAADQREEAVEPYALAPADVEVLEHAGGRATAPAALARGPIDGGHRAPHGVTNIGELAFARPLALLAHGEAARAAIGEGVDREIGPLAPPAPAEWAGGGARRTGAVGRRRPRGAGGRRASRCAYAAGG